MITDETDWSVAAIAATRRPVALSLFRLLRARQWVKNGFVLGPLIFSRSFVAVHLANEAVIAVTAFCLASSAGYIVNDLNDLEADRRHPTKRLTRPLAAGDVSKGQACALLAVVLALLGGLVAALPVLIPSLTAYLVLTFSYSVFLKRIAVLDLFAIALGFVLRAFAGASAIGVPLSFWMSITTLCLALYLAAVKRKQELLQSGSESRGVLRVYTPELLSSYAQTAAVSSVIFYGLYVATVATTLVYTLPLF